jgi:hypothetical protein
MYNFTHMPIYSQCISCYCPLDARVHGTYRIAVDNCHLLQRLPYPGSSNFNMLLVISDHCSEMTHGGELLSSPSSSMEGSPVIFSQM